MRGYLSEYNNMATAQSVLLDGDKTCPASVSLGNFPWRYLLAVEHRQSEI